MNCPHCGAEHPETAGRFCDSCGRSVQQFANKSVDQQTSEEPPKVRCRFCGSQTTPPVCRECGNRVPIPDGWEPGD